MSNDIPARRTPASVRQWLRDNHILLFQRTHANYAPFAVHCECCGAAVRYDDTYYSWQSYDNGLDYRLCGYCDVQARILATDFVHRLKHAIYDPESAVAGWPLRAGDEDE